VRWRVAGLLLAAAVVGMPLGLLALRELAERALAALVAERYGADPAGLAFVPVGGDGWHYRCPPFWVSVRRDRQGHVPNAYAAAGELARGGLEFVLAPLPDSAGRVVHRLGPFPVVVLPLNDGATLDDTGMGEDDLRAVAALCERLHAATCATPLPTERYELPFAAELRDGLAAAERAGVHTGPYGERLRDLVARNRDGVAALIAEMGALASACRADPAPLVLTHGEPSGNNVLRDAAGRLYLVDWGDLAYGPPERDWSALVPYGLKLPVRPQFARFYKLRWILGEVGEYVARFAAPHEGNAEDAHKWGNSDATCVERAADTAVLGNECGRAGRSGRHQWGTTGQCFSG
jgi:spectinomycin phosphotransferase